ncbi:MAG TPA: hypothetical protein VGJ50_08910 [Streptosporangiaceae bacterium]
MGPRGLAFRGVDAVGTASRTGALTDAAPLPDIPAYYHVALARRA